ncbi:MAG: hypothetical protein MRJ93_00190 [Nitrososphaeraceae archaeon]|nr:hypothetical protein [Nitrososphaeraceae archaeon]
MIIEHEIDDDEDVEVLCKNCQHRISLHDPVCGFVLEDDNEHENAEKKPIEMTKHLQDDLDRKGDKEQKSERKCCECDNPEFYNAVISGKYIGWTEIHCNNCGKLLCYIDSSSENVYDFVILCKKCIVKKH